MRILLAVLLLAAPVFGQTPGQTPAVPAQGPPPSNLTQRADGRFSANDDPATTENFEVHVVQAGDTLSGIAARFLNNARLWPQLWEQNDHIVNPHWIYPNDRILIRPITLITEATPPPAEPEPAPAPAIPAPSRSQAGVLRAQPIQPEAGPREDAFLLTGPPTVPEVKTSDLYCSGFVRMESVSEDFKVIGKYDSAGGALASETDYIYLDKGSEEGVRVGDMYQVIRSTKKIDNPGKPARERNLGMHYLEVAQVRVMIVQPAFSMARVVHSCDGVELGDFMVPFQEIELPPLPRPRPFSPFMTAAGGVSGSVVITKNALLNFGSVFRASGTTPGARRGSLAPLEGGIASEGTILYIDIGRAAGVRPGDLFVIYRQTETSDRLYDLPESVSRLAQHRTAIGELVVLKVEERASTALVTYSADGISQGDVVERR